MKTEQKHDQLMNENYEMEVEILDKLETLIKTKWDANTLKIEIEKLVKQRDKIWDEIFELDDKQNSEVDLNE